MKAILNNNPCILTIGSICVVIIGVLTMQYEMRRQIEAQRAIIRTEKEMKQDRDWGVRRRTTSRDTLPDGKTIRVTIETTSDGQTLKETHDYAL
ncbi:MAG: hypothetical protein ACFN4U_02470 [Candidatus Absconditicoccaceae bacterium]